MSISPFSDMKEPEPPKVSHLRRPTIAYFAYGIHDSLQHQWIGVADAARQYDMNLICVPGQALQATIDFGWQANILYDLISPETVDGIVSWTSTLDSYSSADEVNNFYAHYRPLPIVSIGRVVDGIPSIVMESYRGMCEVVTHLIEEHGCRRIAFIQGPEDHRYAQERYRAYMDTLAAHDIAFDENLVTPPFPWGLHRGISSGMQAIRVLFDERKLQPRRDFEAIVSPNDHILLGAIKELRMHGIQVPGDVAVTGFDDTAQGRIHMPSFTSVTVPFYEIGYRAVEMLSALISGQTAPAETLMPSKLVVRQSCGCYDATVIYVEEGRIEKTSLAAEASREDMRYQILEEMRQVLEMPPLELTFDWAERLFDGFMTALDKASSRPFLHACEDVLYQIVLKEAEVSLWQNVISVMRRRMLPFLTNNAPDTLHLAEQLWQQARVMIGETAQRVQARRTAVIEERMQMLRDIGQTLLLTVEIAPLMKVLARKLPDLQIPGGYLAIYENPQPYRYPQPVPEWSRLLLAYQADIGCSEAKAMHPKGGVELPPEGQRFLSRQLLPDGMWLCEKAYCMVLEPLFFREDQIGFAMFEVGPRDGSIYEMLRGQISSALQGALLMQRIQKHSAELVREQYMMNTFMENVPDSIYFKDLDSRIIRVNNAHAAHFGFDDPADEIGKTDFDLFPETEARLKYKQEQQIIRTGQPMVGIEEPRAGGGWSLTTKIPLRDEHGEIIGTFGISRDITRLKQTEEALEAAYAEMGRRIEEQTAELRQEILERKQVEERLVEERNLLRTLIDNLPDRVYVKDTKSRFLLANRATVQAAEKTEPVDLIGKTIFDVFPTDLAEEYYADDQRVIQSGEPLLNQEEPSVDLKTGERRWLLTTKVPFTNSQGQTAGLVGIARDITEIKDAQEELRKHRDHLEDLVKERTTELTTAITEAEQLNAQLHQEIVERKRTEIELQHAKEAALEALRAAEEAQRAAEEARRAAETANHAKSEFLAHMSHELRTPLNGILGYAQILQRDQDCTSSQQEGLAIIEHCGTHLLTLIDEILDLSRIEAQKIELHVINFLFPEFLSTIAAMIRIKAQQKGLTFRYEPAPDIPRVVQADKKRLSQVLLNLLSNAVKFTETGSVTLRIANLRFEIADLGDLKSQVHKIRFEISDTGIGIPEENLEEVFSAFIQVEKHARTIEGTGLGLAISRELVRLMGSELHVESAVNKGSTFWFDVAISEGAEETAVTEVRGKRIVGFHGDPRKVLIIDDKWENRTVLTNLLRPLGFDIMEAQNGVEGLQKADEWEPDLILMDIIMPVMDGLEATRRIRQFPQLKHVKILAISASASEKQQRESLEVGCDGFLAKPVQADDLFENVGELLQLDWIYEKHEDTVPEQDVVIPSDFVLDSLYELARDGDFLHIQQQLEHLEQEDSCYHPFVTKIRNFARQFQDDEICQYITQCKDRKMT